MSENTHNEQDDATDEVILRFDTTPLAKSIAVAKSGKTFYPFDELEIGKSFGVTYTPERYKSLSSNVNRRNKKFGMTKFVVVHHVAENGIEVARLL